MASLGVHIADYVLFVGLTASSLGAGLYLSLRRRSHSQDEAFLGSRSIPSFPLAVSAVASSVTAMSIIAFVAHYYVYGFHTLWAIPAFVPAGLVVTYLFLPVLYELKVTSIFEYLRMRYGNSVGITASLIYFVLSQALGAVAIYSAALAVSTMFGLSSVIAAILLGIAGTIYTALGGLRSVVWADCIQGLIMTASPLIIIGKIIYDAVHSEVPPRPLTEFNSTFYFVQTSMDLTTDETIWAAAIGAFPFHVVRLGLDQMITQRFLAAKSLRDAKVVAFTCIGILSFFYALNGVTALAIIYWFRDCDPLLTGAISRYDQIVPYYINKYAIALVGLRGLFLSGVVCASISTISSIVNSHAAVLYVDIVSPYFKIPERRTTLVMAALAAASGTIMTLFGLLVPYIGSAARFFIALYAAASGPFAGIIVLAFLFPWANAKGTAIAALGIFSLQIWQMAGRFESKIEPLRMTYSVDRCPANSTLNETFELDFFERPMLYTNASANYSVKEDGLEVSDVFPLYQISAYWCCLFSTLLTVVLGLAFSLVLSRSNADVEATFRHSSPVALRFWRWTTLLGHDRGRIALNGTEFKASPVELEPLQGIDADYYLNAKPSRENGVLVKPPSRLRSMLPT